MKARKSAENALRREVEEYKAQLDAQDETFRKRLKTVTKRLQQEREEEKQRLERRISVLKEENGVLQGSVLRRLLGEGVARGSRGCVVEAMEELERAFNERVITLVEDREKALRRAASKEAEAASLRRKIDEVRTLRSIFLLSSAASFPACGITFSNCFLAQSGR